MGSHARLGPSNHRWPHCPGSVREEANYEDIAGAAAIDGTGSHELLELCLENNVRADTYIGMIIGTNHHDQPMGWYIDDDRVARVQMCLDYVSRRHRELTEQYPNGVITVESESKSNPGGLVGRDDWWGTVDITITVMEDGQCLFIEICDYKDGRMWVSVADRDGQLNTQLVSYGLGKMRSHIGSGPEKVRPFISKNVGKLRLSIVQPKTNPPVRYEDVTVDQMVVMIDLLSMAASKTDDPDAPCIPDNKGGKGYCQWCKHRKDCVALLQQPIDMVKTMTNTVVVAGSSLFETIEQTFTGIEQMSELQLADLLDTRAGLNAAYDRVNAEIQCRVDAGKHVPGYEMRPGRMSQKWIDDDESIEAKLKSRRLKKSDIYPQKLISPAAVMKLSGLTEMQKKKIKEELIVEVAGKMALTKVARTEAKRVEKDVQSMFSGVEHEPTISFI